MTCDWSMIIVDVFMCCEVDVYSVVICFFTYHFQPCLFSAPEIFYSRCTWNEKPAPKNSTRKMELIYGAGFLSVCHGPAFV